MEVLEFPGERIKIKCESCNNSYFYSGEFCNVQYFMYKYIKCEFCGHVGRVTSVRYPFKQETV